MLNFIAKTENCHHEQICGQIVASFAPHAVSVDPMSSCTLLMSLVNTPEARPYSVALPRLRTPSMSLRG